MDKEIITFSATQQTLIKTGGIDCFAGETVKYVEARFDLGENWSGFDHIDAIWTNDGNFTQIAKTLDPQGVCIVPVEVLSSIGDVRVNLVGVTSEEDVITERLTTYPIFALGVNANVPLSGSETQPITASQFDQFVAIVIAEVEKVTGMTAEAVTLPPGSDATAEYTNGKLILGIPQGIQGEKGDTGETGNGIDHVLFNSDYSLSIVFTNGEIFRTPPIRGERGPQGPQGVPGDTGETGATPDIQIGSVETLPAGSPAEVTITGTPEDPVLNFKLPEGDKGDTGETPDIQIGTVETLPAGSPAEVTITGTPEDPELNFKIPKGDTGEVTLEDLSSLLPLDTATGDIISIPDGQPVIPVQSLKVQLSPKQSGSGTPSPDNVRPIEGWTDVDTCRTGKNLFDPNQEFDLVNCYAVGGDLQARKGVELHLPRGSYTFSATKVGSDSAFIYVNKVNADGSFVSFAYLTTDRTSNVVTYALENGQYLIIYDAQATTESSQAKFSLYAIQLELGSSAASYEQYDGSVIHTAIEGHYTPVGTNNVPYILRDTPDVDGDRLREKIVGGTVAWNQLVGMPSNPNTTNGITVTLDETTGIYSLSGTSTNSYASFFSNWYAQTGHKYVSITTILANPNNVSFKVRALNIAWPSSSDIVSSNYTQTTACGIVGFSANTDLTGIKFRASIIDLTQMFGSTIADYIYSLEQSEAGAGVAFFKSLFPADYYPYNSGELMSVKTSAHVMTDADENAVTYPLDDIELRGIPKLADGSLYYDGDTYEADGSVTRKYGIVDLGTLTWMLNTAYGEHCFSAVVNGKMGGAVNSVCSKYVAEAVAIASLSNKAYRGHGSNSTIYVRDDSYSDATAFKSAMSGVMLVYELATPTSESATPFEEIQKVFTGGTEAYTDNRTVSIPVGHETEYLSRVVYGCTIDIVTGELVIDKAKYTFTGEESWSLYSSNYAAWIYGGLLDALYADNVRVISDTFNGQLSGGGSAHTADGDIWLQQTPSYKRLYVCNSNATSQKDMQTYTRGTTVVYELANPITVNLTPEEIKLLLGDNTIWSDGPVTMIYSADVTRWIQKKLGS